MNKRLHQILDKKFISKREFNEVKKQKGFKMAFIKGQSHIYQNRMWVDIVFEENGYRCNEYIYVEKNIQ